MAVYISNELGKVEISDKIIAGIIEDAMEEPYLADKVWPVTRKGNIMDSVSLAYPLDFASYVEADLDNSGLVTLSFPVIIKFGAGIGAVTDRLAEEIRKKLESELDLRSGRIILNIKGVKSKNIARRDVEVVKEFYESE